MSWVQFYSSSQPAESCYPQKKALFERRRLEEIEFLILETINKYQEAQIWTENESPAVLFYFCCVYKNMPIVLDRIRMLRAGQRLKPGRQPFISNAEQLKKKTHIIKNT